MKRWLCVILFCSTQRVWAQLNVPISPDDFCKDAYFSKEEYCRSFQFAQKTINAYQEDLRKEKPFYFFMLQVGVMSTQNKLQLRVNDTVVRLEPRKVDITFKKSFP